MRRINLGKLPREGFFFTERRSPKTEPSVRWTNALLMAHVDTPQGPDLRILREDVEDEAVLRVESGEPDGDSHAQALVIIDEMEIIISMMSDSPENNADSSVMVGFDVESPIRAHCEGVGTERPPAMILRNFEEGMLHVLDEHRPTAELHPGLWTIQSASVPDGEERTGVIRFEPISRGHHRN